MASKEHNWNEQELNTSVDGYFDLHRRTTSGEKLVLAHAFKALIASGLPKRNQGSIERRMANISAVLIELGLPWCERFKPLRNVGAKVKKVIITRIHHHARVGEDLTVGGLVRDDLPTGQSHGSKKEKDSTEGARRLVSHYVIERNAAAAEEAKKRNRLANGGEYCCQVCDDKPGIRYGARVIDAHHIRPISETGQEYQVRPEDFLIVCPNCHRAIHRLDDYSGAAIRSKLGKA